MQWAQSVDGKSKCEAKFRFRAGVLPERGRDGLVACPDGSQRLSLELTRRSDREKDCKMQQSLRRLSRVLCVYVYSLY